MNILLLAPQPFYQDRGTVIAIDLLLSSYSQCGCEADLLAFHLGDDRSYPNVEIIRISPPFAPKAINPGFSLKKVYCDVFLFTKAFSLMRKKKYDFIHAVEEASFISMVLGRIFRTPYVFDMDSSMSTQLLDRFNWLRPFSALLRWFESLPMKYALGVVPMCEDLAEVARRHCSGFVHVLKDVSLLTDDSSDDIDDLRGILGIEGPIAMYVGNLESYQGIDLLLESFERVAASHSAVHLVVIGGNNADINAYKAKAAETGLSGRVHFVGPRPVSSLGNYLQQADILVSPRIHGTNTPMKIYSYLDSGVPVLATRMPTHTQVMSDSDSMLASPEPESMAKCMLELLDDETKRNELASNAKDLIRREHSLKTFHSNVGHILDDVSDRISMKEPV